MSNFDSFSLLISRDAQVLWGVNVLIQVSIIAVLSLLIVRYLKNNAVLRWWVLGSALALILFSPVTALMTQFGGVGFIAISNAASESPAFIAQKDVLLPRRDQTPALPAQPVTNPLLNRDLPLSTPGEARPISNHSKVTEAAQDAPRWAPADWMMLCLRIALSVWLAGVFWKLSRMAHGWRRLVAIRSSARRIEDLSVVHALSQASSLLAMSAQPALLQTEHVTSPVAAGIFRPAILLPSSLMAQMDREQLKEILLHEAAHVARRDQVIVVAQNLVTCLFWIHPLVRMVNQRFAQAREEVCDNYVLSSTSAPSYSRTLLTLAERVTGGDVLPASVGMLDGWKLESRVAGLLQRNRNTDTRLTRRSVVLVVALFGCLLAFAGMATISVVGDESKQQPDQPLGSAKPKMKKGAAADTPRASAESSPDADDSDKLQADGAMKPLPASAELQFHGRVVDPQGQAVEGARVYFARQNAAVLAVTDSAGNFAFTCTKGRLPNNAQWGNIKLVAVAEGFGLAISPGLRFESSGKGMKDLMARNPNKKFAAKRPEPILKLVNDDVPINGRIVDLEGQPVPDVAIQLRFVNQAYARFAFNSVTTDRDGRFTIRGIGRDRTVRLVAKGDRTEFSVFFAQTKDVTAATKTSFRQTDPFDLAAGTGSSQRVTYGCNLTHAIGPSTPLEGQVTEAGSGKPLSGVTVYAYELPNNSEVARREELYAITDEDGRYRLVGLPVGDNRLYGAPPAGTSHLQAVAQVRVTDDVPVVNGDFTITKGVMLSGRAIDATTGEPLRGFVDYSAVEGNEYLKEATTFLAATELFANQTDKDGNYRIPVLPGKGYVAFRVRGDLYPVGVLSDAAAATKEPQLPYLPARPVLMMTTTYSSIDLIEPEPEETHVKLDFKLKRSPKVIVKVVDPTDRPLMGSSITENFIYPQLGFARGMNPVSLKGDTYRVKQFTQDGLTVLMARHKDKRLIGRLQIDNPRDCELTLKMQRAGRIRGRVVDDKGNPRVIRIDGYDRIFTTDDDGRFDLPLVLAGYPVTLRALHREQQQMLGTILSEVTLSEGEELDVGDVTVKPNQ